ncbi:MAG: hypothetical protein ACRDZ4_12000 [Egibacteraceae bacterium]
MNWLKEVEHLLEQAVAEGRLHLVDVERLPDSGAPAVTARFVAVCTCGWRSADEEGRQRVEDAGMAHVCAVPRTGGDRHERGEPAEPGAAAERGGAQARGP